MKIRSRSLILLACAQIAVLGFLYFERTSAPEATIATSLDVGDTITVLTMFDERGKPVQLGASDSSSRWTVLLSVYSHCIWCDSIAPTWKEYIDQPHDYVVHMVSREPIDTLIEYADSKGYDVSLLSIGGATDGSLERELTGKTPWIYVLDSDGVLRLAEHGFAVDSLDSFIRAQSESRR